MPTTNLCEDCHSTQVWSPVTQVDHTQVTGTCQSCHNGVIADGKPRTLEFGVADETAWQAGLSCGGTIRVYVEKVE